jgi:chemotaxis protein MotA
MEIMLEGVISIQRGDHPAVLKEKLQSFLAPAIREKSA